MEVPAWLVASLHVVVLATAPQESSAAPEDLTRLTLDELIERLPPVGSEWVRKSRPRRLVPAAEEFRQRIERGAELDRERWKRVLYSTGMLRTRARWPASEAIAVSMQDAGWLPRTRVRLDPRDPELERAEAGWLGGLRCGTYSAWKERGWLYQPLGELPLGPHTLLFDLSLERGPATASRLPTAPGEIVPPPGVYFRGVLELEVEIVATLDEAMPPRASPELDALVRRTLSVAFADWATGRTALLVVDPDVREPELARLGLSLDIELRCDGRPVQALHLRPDAYDPYAPSSSVHDAPQQPIAFNLLRDLPIALENDPLARDAWSIHVQGTAERVIELWEADTYWNGTLDIPVDELIERERQVAPEGRGPWVYMPSRR